MKDNQHVRIQNGTELGKFLDKAISESYDELRKQSINEKEKQVTAVQSKPAPEGEPDKEQQSKTMSDDTEAMQGDVELKDVVEKLNTIRSGKSFKDSLVEQRFEEYFNSLADAEKVAMFAFLKGIAQIVTGEVPAEQATEPSDKPADVEMQKGNEKQTKSVKPNVIKKPEAPPGKKTSSNVEDVTPPVTAKKR